MAIYEESAERQVAAPAPTTPPRAATRTRRRRGAFGTFTNWLLVLLVLLLLLALAGALALLLSERYYAGRIYPNVNVRGLNLSAYSEPQARAALERRYSAFLAQPVELSFGNQRWQPSAAELGLRIDFERVLREAATIGRENTRIENARAVQATWEQGVDLPLHLQIDRATLQRYLIGIAASLESAPINADVQLIGANVQLFSDKAGLQVLVDETSADIVAAVQPLAPQQVALRTRILQPGVRAADLATVEAEARALLQGPLVLRSGEQEWVWSTQQIASWLKLRRDAASGTAVGVALEQEPIRRELASVAATVRRQGELPRVDWNNGQLRIIAPGTSDYGLDGSSALNMIVAALQSSQRTVELPMTELPPAIDQTNLANLNITAPVGTGLSSFRASQNYRITNIRAGARLMHGLLIAPGATFSFNDNLGTVDASSGFVQGSAIVDNRTQKEWGGGLCQVSTTMFRAAFWGGLPIAERHEHAFRIGWYEELGEPPGLDAAIYTPFSDFKFTNDTGGWLLIQSEVDLQRQRLTITLYGTPTGRSVMMSHRILERMPAPRKALYITDPALPRSYFKRTDFARPGVKLEVYRTVRQGEAVLRNDTFATEFKPWPNIYVRGGRR